MSVPIPETASPLPVPEGFSTLSSVRKADAIEKLRTDPRTDLKTLQGVAWNVLGDSFYSPWQPHSNLFSEAGLALLTIIERKDELPPDDPTLYLDTRLTLATFDAFAARREQRILGSVSRFQIARNAGSLLKEIAEPADFDLDALPQPVRPKVLDAMMIGACALRQRWPYPLVVPAMPKFHRLWQIDAGTNTSAFSLYLTRRVESNQPEEFKIPMMVTRNRDSVMHDPTRRRGVLQVALEPLLWNTSNGIESLVEARREQGGMVEARKWLLDQTARQLAAYGASGKMSGDYLALLDSAARYVGKSAEYYDPYGVNALARDPRAGAP